MPYVPVPKDLTKVKTKVAFNLTKRQLVFFSIAGAVGLPVYFLTRTVIGNTASVLLMIGLMMPFFFMAMYERDGQPAEKILKNMIRHRLWPETRPYKTRNFYKIMSKKEEISIAPPEVIDMQAERYVDRNVAYRYNATSVITVTSKNVDRVRKLMSGQAELLKQGIAITGGDYKYNVSYEFTGLNEVKPKMIEEATKNARAAAEKFAKDSDSELGKIRNASQGQFSISDRDAYTPYIKSVRVVTTVNYYLKK